MTAQPSQVRDGWPEHGIDALLNGEFRWWVQDGDVMVSGYAKTREDADLKLVYEVEEWWI